MMLEGFSGKPIQPGDHILTTDHEYGALDRTWTFTCNRLDMHYLPTTIPLPVTNQDDFVERFWARVNDSTRVIFVSHITSPTALIFPVEEICSRARAAGIISIYVGEGEFTRDRLDTFGGYGVMRIPDLQSLMQYICKMGFEHHVAVSISQKADAIAEALDNYMGWEVYQH